MEAVLFVKEEEVDQKPVIEGPSLAIDISDAKEAQQQRDNNSDNDDGDSDIEILDSFFDDSSMGGGGNGAGDGGSNNGEVGFGAVNVSGSSMSFLQGDLGTGSELPASALKRVVLVSVARVE